MCDLVWPCVGHLGRSSACPVVGRTPGNLRQQRYLREHKPLMQSGWRAFGTIVAAELTGRKKRSLAVINKAA